MPSKRPAAFFEPLESRILCASESPFKGTPIAVPGTIEAENFDKGGEGVAYHDNGVTNLGNAYRTTEGVDITTGGSNGFHVEFAQAGEWLQYTVNVTNPGTYQITFAVSSLAHSGQFHLNVDGSDKTGKLNLPKTGSATNWVNVTKTGVSLAGGTHTLRLSFDSGNNGSPDIGNIDFIKFTKTGSGTSDNGFHPKPLNWKQVASNPVDREEAESFVYNGKLYALGGYRDDFTATTQVDVYDPKANKWTRIKDMPYKVTHAAVAPDPDGHTFWFVGGFIGDIKHDSKGKVIDSPATNIVYKYNAATQTWTKAQALPSARGAGGAGIVNGKLYIFGGFSTTQNKDVSESYVLDLSNQSAGWKPVANLPNSRNHLGGIVVNGMIYAIGGQHQIQDQSAMVNEVDRYDPVTNKWTKVASLPVNLSHYNASTVLYNRYIITVGGENPHNVPKPYVFAYDTVMNKWASLTNLPDPRRAGVAGVIGNLLIQSTGFDGPQKETATTYEADLSNVFV
ncbi:MAG TPA: kelch repeat-containing protein [Tepidisphaeraceae bacterium]|nr:kelch repeat-containing protein [Tepidisphaeraceae bacterium]